MASGKASKTKEEEAAAGEEEEEEEEAAEEEEEEEEEEAENKGEKKDVKVRKSANDQIQTKAPMKDKEAKDAIAEFMERQNRPYSVQNILDHFQQRIKKVAC